MVSASSGGGGPVSQSRQCCKTIRGCRKTINLNVSLCFCFLLGARVVDLGKVFRESKATPFSGGSWGGRGVLVPVELFGLGGGVVVCIFQAHRKRGWRTGPDPALWLAK